MMENNGWDSRICSPITRIKHAHEHNLSYYAKCMFGGVLSCGLTHTVITPLDVTKCRIQSYPLIYKNLFQSIKKIIKEEKFRSLSLGWSPTLVGYSLQGLFKFGFYEIFKDVYSNYLGEQYSYKYKGVTWLLASASAEFVADIFLCPFEMIKVKMQTSKVNTFPNKLFASTTYMLANKSETKFPFGSVTPLWCRQIPYTMAKFYFFEKIVQLMYDKVFTKPKNTYSDTTQLGITFASGYLSGIICALVSHPADNMISQLGKVENKGKGVSCIVKEMGVFNLFTKGICTRVLMIGTLTGLQWWIYDTFKATMGLGTSGGGSAVKK
ncbi:mitochondrial phosphate carrier protein [Plasmodium brasilianum]|uniref:Mitochondrial phosphate carrier protein, putative n=2 Tax=Plasmodium (Plasmodium) TaxID=418103 RepID=A0A1A8WV99_PLAMA|nr:mitochondrial phosphate carrier protein, putative [Plasmodium malariae]KAI4835555.1 mitochondrial phosphate carrier protein [Plasmodium brasilianum]SBS95789.1 mitochondrial phosphate carrier protein, putative [Plasmodium malariae]SCP02478.1 mitochondrial phosphate carrier protein, putative [Plasmodium malariae]